MNNESKNKNVVIIILSIVIVLLLIGMAVILTTKNQNNNGGLFGNQNSVMENNPLLNTDNSINPNPVETPVKNPIENPTENPGENVSNAAVENTITNEPTTTTENTVESVPTTTENTTNNAVQTPTNSGTVTEINTAIVNGVKITVPATKESFVNTGWEWDAKYANNDLATGYTTSGGRLGKYPGGAVLSVINNSGQTKKIQDCIVDSMTFYNPGDGSENVTFIGGLNYNSTAENVKTTFTNLGYKNGKERNYETSNYYTYYLNDSSANYRDYIEFYFFKGALKSVTIKGSVK